MYDEKLLQQRLSEFHPEPLITVNRKDYEMIEIPMVKEDENIIDLAKANYLNVLNCEEIKKCSEKLIREYGVGTCGPRAFYGTTDVHLELEEELAKFLHMEESIIYSYGFVAISSSIAAYCKKSDIVFIDEKANFPTHQGLTAAKSKVVTFSHVDPQDLKNKLQNICMESDKMKKARKFLILEGISWATGKLCNLPEFVAVAEEFKMRIFLEESYSFGVFGENGRGLTEHFNIDPSRLDMIFGTLQGAIGSIGGFCAGSNLIIEHQRLSGAGYIFSASLPTYLVKAVLKSLELLGDKPAKLRNFAEVFHKFLIDCGFTVESYEKAPFKSIVFKNPEDCSKVHKFCKQDGVHFIQKDDGLMINLNIGLLEDAVRLQKVYDVLRGAAKLVQN